MINSEARKRKEEAIALELAKNDPYREYYLVSEEGFKLSDTVGVTKEEWDAHQARYAAAIEACEKFELFYD